jgi:CubicO group peptidase (beta-lactamase class C family)
MMGPAGQRRWAPTLPILLILAACATVPSPPAPTSGSYSWVGFDRAGVRRSGAAGLADRAANRAITPADPVRIASISKLVTTLGVMRLVEQGKLDLDADVSDRLGWTLRNPAFPDDKITLRLLLSHRSSLRDQVDYAIPLGTEIRTVLGNPKAFDTEHRPGTFFRYTNLNFPVVATIMEAATGERFDRLMEREVFRPLGLDACFNWTTCSDAAVARAVVLYAKDGTVVRDDLGGARPACPVLAPAGVPCVLSSYRPGSNGALFSPQGGLRISSEGLAAIGRMLLAGGMHDGKRFLGAASVEAMLRPEWQFDGANGETEKGFYCSYGLAVQILPTATTGCSDDLLGDGTMLVGHAGDAYGVKSGLWIDRKRGNGIAYFATAVPDDAPTGTSAFRGIEEWLARQASGR